MRPACQIAAVAYVLVAKPFDVQRDLVWPADLGGRPAGLGEIDEIAAEVTPEVEPGAYLWNDFDGWHLWFAFGDGFDRATGTIRSDDDVSKLLLSPTSSGTASGDGGEVSFEPRRLGPPRRHRLRAGLLRQARRGPHRGPGRTAARRHGPPRPGGEAGGAPPGRGEGRRPERLTRAPCRGDSNGLH
ncbi:MAG: hypothetical protein R2711_18850 [Acidimicrobiales bacterium]